MPTKVWHPRGRCVHESAIKPWHSRENPCVMLRSRELTRGLGLVAEKSLGKRRPFDLADDDAAPFMRFAFSPVDRGCNSFSLFEREGGAELQVLGDLHVVVLVEEGDLERQHRWIDVS